MINTAKHNGLSTAINGNETDYKKTKLGWIPAEWEIVTLSEIGEFSKGKGIAKKDLLEKGTDGLCGIRYAEIYTLYKYYTESLFTIINKESAENSNPINYGDILFAGSGETLKEIGKSIAYLGDEIAYAGGDIIILKQKTQNSKYLSYLLNNDIVRNQLFKLGQGHSVVHIYSGGLKKILIPLPPLPEQQKIAQILSTWDKAIAAQEKLIAEKQQLKKGLMQLLLTGEKRFPGFEEEWEEVKLEDIGEIITGNTPSKKNKAFWNGKFYWATADDMNNKYINKTLQSLTFEGNTKARKARKGSVLVTCIASIGKNVIANVDTAFNQQINSITPNRDYDTEFVYYLIDFNPNKLLAYAGAGAMPMLNKNTFKSIKFSFPKLQEQQKIATVLSNFDTEIESLINYKNALIQQKQGLMQQLLTGEKRVKI